MEATGQEAPNGDALKIELYQNSDYVSLYRFENPTIPYDESREGIVSKKDLVGSWYCDSLDDLKTYTVQRTEGTKGGRFVVVRIKKDDLDKYDARKLPETSDMDIESGNYIIPDDLGQKSRVEIEGIFKESWSGKKNIPMADWQDVENYIKKNLSEESLISRLQKT